jgi:hypothetical protein
VPQPFVWPGCVASVLRHERHGLGPTGGRIGFMEELVVRLRPFEEADLVCFDRFGNDQEYSPYE